MSRLSRPGGGGVSLAVTESLLRPIVVKTDCYFSCVDSAFRH